MQIFLAVLSIVWGAWLLVPVDTFSHVPGMRLVSQMIGENALGVMMIAIGAFKLWSAPRGGHASLIGATAGALFWFTFAVLIFPAQPYGIAWVWYLLFAGANVHCVWRYLHEGKHV